jgi:hypothetical protein
MRRQSERLSSPAPRPFDFQKTLQRHLHGDESDEHSGDRKLRPRYVQT